MKPHTTSSRIPLWLKLSYSAFMAVLLPVYWYHYGVTNFLFFCDVALILTLIGVWLEKPLLISLPAVGILIPQAIWCIDFVSELTGHKLTGMTSYMLDAQRPLILRALSLFHGWLPFMLLFLVTRVGYDRRALKGWSYTATALCLFSFFMLPAPGSAEVLANPQLPYNVNYVFGMSETEPQNWMHPNLYLLAWLSALIALVYVPTHALLLKICPTPAQAASSRS